MGNEEVLLQFTATDNVSSVVQAMQTSVVSSITSMQTAMAQLNEGLGNISIGAINIGQVFGSGGFQGGATVLEDIGKASGKADSGLGNVKSSANDASKASENLADAGKTVVTVNQQLGNTINNTTRSTGRNTSETRKNATEQKGLGKEASNTSNEFNLFNGILNSNADYTKLSAGSAMYLAGQLSTLGTQAQQAAEALNDTKIGVDQVGKMAGVTEEEMTDMITTMSNETFSNDEAVMYTKNLVQMGVAADKYVEQATNIDRINDAFGLGAETTNSLVSELSVLGVDMNDIASSFNALAYANENTVGGMQNYYAFLRKYDSELNKLGYDADQTAIIIAATTKKYGGGRAALSGLSEALDNAGSDASALEAELGLQAGTLAHASKETGTYAGQLQNLANEEMEHKTWLERIGAAWDDFKLQHAGAISTIESGFGVFGTVGHYALLTNALLDLSKGFGKLTVGYIGPAIERMGLWNKTVNSIPKINPSAMTPVDLGGKTPKANPSAMTPIDPRTINVKNTGQVAKTTETVVKDAGAVGGLAGDAAAAETGMVATTGALSGISSAFTAMIVPLLAIAAVIAVIIPIIAGLAVEALLFLKGIQIVIKALNFDDIDLSKAIESIKQIGAALWEIGLAMGAMTFASIMTIFSSAVIGLSQLVNPIQVAGQQLVNVANELTIFNSVNIDKSIPDKIKSITESLKLVSDAMKSLFSLSVDMAWGNLIGRVLGSVGDAIRSARKDIVDAGNEIAKIKDIPNLDEDAVKKLETVGTAIESVAKAFEGLRSIRDNHNWDEFWSFIPGDDIQGAIDSVEEDLNKASTALQDLKLKDVPEDVGSKLQNVASALENFAKAFESLRKIRDDYNWDTGWLGGWFQDSNIQQSIDGIKEQLISVSKSLQSLSGTDDGGKETGLATIGEEVSDKIKNVTDTLEKVLGAVDAMKKFKGKGEGEGGDDFSGITTTITNAKDSLISVSKALKSLSGTDDGGKGTGLATVGEDITTKIDSISKTLKTLSDSMNTLKSFPVVSGDEIPTRIQKAVTVIWNSARHLNGLNGMSTIDSSVGEIIASVGKNGGKLKTSINNLMDFPVVSGNEIPLRIQKAVTVVKNGARHLNKLVGTEKVDASISSVISSVGSQGTSLKNSINKLKGFPIVSGNEIPNRVNKAVTAVKGVSKQIKKLKSSDKVSNVSSILSSIKKAVDDLKKTLSSSAGSFNSAGVDIAQGLKNGIDKGLSNLSGIVIKQVATSMEASKPTAFTYGKGLGGRAVAGFQESFLLSQVITNELTASATAIANGTPALTSAMGSLAQQMVDEFKANAEIASPGAIARSIRDEMGYTRGFIETRGKDVITSVGTLARSMVNNFNPNLQSSLDTVTGKLTPSTLNRSRLNALRGMGDNVVSREGDNQRPVTININEGAIKVDANNLTKRESRQILVNAIEGLDVIDGINVRGV